MGRVLTFTVVLVGLAGLATAGMQAQRTGSGAQAPARAAPAVPTSDEALTSLRAALADSAVRSSLARHVRRLRVDAASLEAYAPAEYDLRNVQSDATLPAPDRITPAEIQGLTRARAPRPGPNVQVLTPPAGRLPGFTPAPSPGRGLTTAPTPSLDVNAFGQQLHNALSPNVTGYVMRLRRGGQAIYTLQWNWAQTTANGSLGWSPSRRMHIASISKLITAIAMTRALRRRRWPRHFAATSLLRTSSASRSRARILRSSLRRCHRYRPDIPVTGRGATRSDAESRPYATSRRQVPAHRTGVRVHVA